MRLLHTSDWHLGRQFHQSSLLEEQSAAVDRMVELAAAERVDAVVIAGDLFDRAIPSTGAVELLDEALVRLRDTGALVVAITGNHDSASRAGFGDRLLTRAGVTLRADVTRLHEPVVVGQGADAVAIYPVPYLDPVTVGHLLVDPRRAADAGVGPADGGERAERRRPTHQDVLRRAMRRIRADRRHSRLPSVVVAHAFVANLAPTLDEAPVEESDSERPLSVGGADRVDHAVFRGVDYVALGHLHGRQSWDGGRIAYPGSPLAYSFSEQHHRKGVRIVELGPGGLVRAEHVELGVGRGLCTITGVLEELLTLPEHAHAEPLRLRAVLTDAELPAGAMARLRTRFPHAAEVVHRPPERTRPLAHHSTRQLRQRRPLDLALDFVAEQWDAEVDAASAAVLRRAVTAVVGEDR
jgi:exonuclease SbcD